MKEKSRSKKTIVETDKPETARLEREKSEATKPARLKVQENANKNKKNTSLRLEKKTLKALKLRAIEEDTSVQKLIESLINKYLANFS
ncbi:MAG: hypothetical protein QM479_06435 [Pseudomonadota bacterium]